MRDFTLVPALIAAALASFGGGSTAGASPWTLDPGRLVLGARVQYQFANDEFLDERSSQSFPLNGFFQSTTLELQGRLGIAEGFDFEMELPVRTVSFASDPVILTPTGVADADTFQENVIDLSQSRTGFSDLRLGLRARFMKLPIAVALQTWFEIPMGYEGPVGTFGERPDNQEAFLADVGRFVRPENVQDDVTLGDGQVNIHMRMHAGYASRSGQFIRGMGGYNIRLDGAGDEVETELRLGQVLGKRWLVYAGGSLAVAVEQGRVIGISVAAIDPELPAEDYGGTSNLLLRELRLERDIATVGAGVIFRPSRNVELNLSYDQIVWGRNVSAVRSFGLTVVSRQEVF